MVHLLGIHILLIILLGCLAFQFEFLLILLLLHQLHFILIAQGINILLFELIHFNSLFNLPLLTKLWVEIDLALTCDESSHVLLNKRLLDNFYNSGSGFFIFDQKHIDEVFHPLTVRIRYGFLLILYNFKNKAEQIFGMKGVFKRT